MIDTLLFPLEWFVATIMVGFHKAFTFIGLPSENGWTWALSIVGLVIVLRILLIPLFVKQIKSSRRLQLIQPEMQKIQAKYKGKKDQESRQKMTEETMELYKRTGTNPFGSCLPILLQSPFFFALFRVLHGLPQMADGRKEPLGPLTQELARQAENSTLFGAQLSSTFLNSDGAAAKIVTMVLIVLMSLTTFTTQRQLMTKNMPAAALDNPMAKQQKYIMYLMPLIFFITGPNFPIGVLIYWLVTNLWSMGQQFYVIRRMPAPGSAAEKALEERNRAKGRETKKLTVPGLSKDDDADGESSDKPKPTGAPGRTTASGQQAGKTGGQRVQPKRNTPRRKR
ncbi:membrane protein insertase YidC [Luteipulveratus halotolerans]|uniref:Membrane protein insertase YidC n=1 Tax=Luteipulveratus halotolerans TaxID=1631356 RepID=A0A0L6CM01_9MICO|nr:membrane protein insertase YidC [Luteipulveratus halotolerans]KNX38759.1 preprotein translocase subunit YidC [Luteipulveratus halotolerans]